jgi:hypothetical protein
MSVSDGAVSNSEVAPEQSEETTDDSAAAATAVTEQATSLPLDQMFEILKNKRRRTVLHYLNENEGPVALGDLAEHVAAVENDTTVPQVTSRERKCVYVGLYQCHLPKMDDMDIVEFNQNRGRVELGPNAAQLQQYLDEPEPTDRPWPVYYGATAGLSLTVVSLTSLVLSGGLVPLGIATLSLLTVTAVAVAHAHSESDSTSARRWVADQDWLDEPFGL